MAGQTAAAGTGFETARAVADAILYEGYLLYPYRRSSAKNRIRWQFGVLVPHSWARAHALDDVSVAGSAESWWQQTECLLSAPREANLHIRVRFLHLQRRWPEELAPDGAFRPADRLEAGGRTEFSFDEAVPRELDVTVSLADLLTGPRQADVEVPGGQEMEPVPDGGGRLAGRVRRRRLPARGVLTMSAVRCDAEPGAVRLRIRVENADRSLEPTAPREQALAVSLLATHVLAATDAGEFVSLLDPPGWAQALARECVNVHTYPVLAGAPERRDAILSSPILLYDYPRIAPESPGDLHDASEIDEILSLRTLTLTDAEKREARATDARGAAILDRVDGMTPEALARLHGVIRSISPLPGEVAGQDGGHCGASVEVAGRAVTAGSRVRLHPRPRGTDVQDMFLAGRTARVESVLADVDGSHHLAVTLDDDPAAEIGRWYGRYRYFSPEEVEPLPPPAPQPTQ